MNRLRLRTEGGFTLIELLVVIAIIGILAAIAIPQFAAYRRRGFEADALSAARNLATAQEGYFVTYSKYGDGAGSAFTNFGFSQGAKVNITTDGTATDFVITAYNTNCTAGTYTYQSTAGGAPKLVSPCS